MMMKVKISKHKNVGIQLISDWKSVFVFPMPVNNMPS